MGEVKKRAYEMALRIERRAELRNNMKNDLHKMLEFYFENQNDLDYYMHEQGFDLLNRLDTLIRKLDESQAEYFAL